ncbi:MAG: hypothetical protein WC549_02110 [Actinomycetota bacterium]
MSLNNLLTGAGAITGNPLISGAGYLLGSIFGDNTTSQSRNTQASLKGLEDIYKKYGIDPTKPFISSEQKREDYSVNNARNQFNRANNFQTLVSSQGEALNNALSQMGLRSGIGSTGMKVGIGSIAPILQNYDAQDAALVNEYSRPLTTTYEDRMKQFADIASSGAGVSSQNFTQQYRDDQMGELTVLLEKMRKEKAQRDLLKNSRAGTSYGLPWQTNIG